MPSAIQSPLAAYLSPKTRTQSQTQAQGTSRREREHPPRLLFQEAGCLSACLLVTCVRSRLHTHLQSAINHCPSHLGQVLGRSSRFLLVFQRLPPVTPSSAHLGYSERDIHSLARQLLWSATRLGPATPPCTSVHLSVAPVRSSVPRGPAPLSIKSAVKERKTDWLTG